MPANETTDGGNIAAPVWSVRVTWAWQHDLSGYYRRTCIITHYSACMTRSCQDIVKVMFGSYKIWFDFVSVNGLTVGFSVSDLLVIHAVSYALLCWYIVEASCIQWSGIHEFHPREQRNFWHPLGLGEHKTRNCVWWFHRRRNYIRNLT